MAKEPVPLDEAGFAQDLVIGVLLACAAIGLVIALVRWVRDRMLHRAATLQDHELVSLTGVVRAGSRTFAAPLSGTTCVAYRARALVEGSESVLAEQEAFVVQTPKGPIKVEAQSLALELVPTRLPPRPDRERALLDRLGVAARPEQTSFDEVVIPVGAKIAIRGMLRIDSDPLATDERGYRDAAPPRMRLVATDAMVTIVRVWH